MKLQQLQKQVKTIGNYLYNKDINPPNTIKECKRKLNFYHFAYNVNYSKVINKITIN